VKHDEKVLEPSRLTAQLRSEKWFNIGGNRSIRTRYTTRRQTEHGSYKIPVEDTKEKFEHTDCSELHLCRNVYQAWEHFRKIEENKNTARKYRKNLKR
jgi:hypothetical protein